MAWSAVRREIGREGGIGRYGLVGREEGGVEVRPPQPSPSSQPTAGVCTEYHAKRPPPLLPLLLSLTQRALKS